MWSLTQIKANNLCSFEHFCYDINQDVTTLIHGENLDNDSQNSNGSGKSALIEAISIITTGDALRPVSSISELIKDDTEEMLIEAIFNNLFSNITFSVSRTIHRKKAQIIKCYLGDKEEVLSGISEYNSYILETLGLTKSDLFNNYILSKHRYKSFLNATDKEKKEIINRFSNGVLVDEGIEHLLPEIETKQTDLSQAQLKLAGAQGSIDTLQDQIKEFEESEEQRKIDKVTTIQSWKEKIAEKRSQIRAGNSQIASSEKELEKLDVLYEKVKNIEDANLCLQDSYNKIIELDIECSDWIQESKATKTEIDTCNRLLSDEQKKIIEAKKKADELTNKLNKFNTDYDLKTKEFDTQTQKYSESKIEISNLIKELSNNIAVVEENIRTMTKVVSNNKLLLMGVVECPACKHKFDPNNEQMGAKNIESINALIEQNESKIAKAKKTVEDTEVQITTQTNSRVKIEQELSSIQTEAGELSTQKNHLTQCLQDQQDQVDLIQTNLDSHTKKINVLTKHIEELKNSMFDEAFDIIDDLTQKEEAKIKRLKSDNEAFTSSIQSFENLITELSSQSADMTISSLKDKLGVAAKKHVEIIEKEIRPVEASLDVLKAQHLQFLEYKTHLANSKIQALSDFTNEFLEKIGSDIRIRFEGFTTLKSGKIKDKISIALIRDGLDCGSFAKFSEGEKTRINLASILAQHELTNTNCPDGKGLNILILDEILEATDENGLASIFEALNKLKLTSLVVSHGNISESYPYNTVVTKLNGISSIA